MKTTHAFAAVLIIIALALSVVPARAEDKMTLFCTAEDRFVIHYLGKKSIVLEQGVGKQVCVSITELYLLTGMDDLAELLVWLNGKNGNRLRFDFYETHAGNVIAVTGQQKK